MWLNISEAPTACDPRRTGPGGWRAKTTDSGLTTRALAALLCLASSGCQLILGDLPHEMQESEDAGASSDASDDEDADAAVVEEGRRDVDASGQRGPDAQGGRADDAGPSDVWRDAGDARDSGSAPVERDSGSTQPSPTDSGPVPPADAGSVEPDPNACAAVDQRTVYRDRDHDGYGETASAKVVCTPAEDGWVEQSGDCHDAQADVHPGQAEFFGAGYRLTDTDRISFDYDCDGLENPGPSQGHAPESCVGLLLCSGGGYLPNTARPAGPGANPYCGSNVESYCTLQALLCQDTPLTTDRRYVCN